MPLSPKLARVLREIVGAGPFPSLPLAPQLSISHDDDMTHHPIVRMWSGVVRTEDRDAYVEYVERTGMAQYRETPGNLDAWLLTRDRDDGRTEIVTVSRWESMSAVVAFAGEDPQRAVYYPEDDEYLVERDDTVRHYEQRR